MNESYILAGALMTILIGAVIGYYLAKKDIHLPFL